jgi:hypothetical protein
MTVFFVLINFFKKLFLTNKNKAKKRQCCFHQRPREVNEICYLPLASGGGGT